MRSKICSRYNFVLRFMYNCITVLHSHLRSQIYQILYFLWTSYICMLVPITNFPFLTVNFIFNFPLFGWVYNLILLYKTTQTKA